MKLIRETDDFDWIRDEVINPWVEYDGINFDAKPTKEEVNAYIELALNSRQVDNRKAWLSGRTTDINLIIIMTQTKKRAFLVLGPDNILSYASDMKYFPPTDNKKPKVIKYSQLKEPKTNINEDADWDWVRSIKPKMPFNQIQLGKKYRFTYGKTFEYLVDSCGINEDVFDATTVKAIKFKKFPYHDTFCGHERDDVVEALLLKFFGVNGNMIRTVWVTEDVLDLHPLK